ncbi:hypothetical protein LTR93_011873 [Exophiala xenobiotica]|nr:hypothetical protein LTR93_011873 [Exophiala xenobiotica]
MSDVDVRIQGIEKTLNKLLELVDRHESRGKHRAAESRSRSQSPWKTIRSIVDKLAQDIQYVKEMVEGSGMKPGHDRSTGADDQNVTLEDPLQILDQPPHEGQQTGQISLDTVGGIQNGGPTSADFSTKTDRRVPTSVESSEVEGNAAVLVSHPIVSTISQSATSAQSVSEAPRNSNITIPYREEQGVVVLMPLNMDQCRDTPFLLSQAEALGARETGIFKYVLPGYVDFSAQAVHGNDTLVSRFTSRLGQNDILYISRTEETDTLDIGDTRFIPTTADALAGMLEHRLTNSEAISGRAAPQSGFISPVTASKQNLILTTVLRILVLTVV